MTAQSHENGFGNPTIWHLGSLSHNGGLYPTYGNLNGDVIVKNTSQPWDFGGTLFEDTTYKVSP